jgi:hypothetical protein
MVHKGQPFDSRGGGGRPPFWASSLVACGRQRVDTRVLEEQTGVASL